jgi:glycosyltransferase involved in cell wall biosynthesis
MSHAAIYALPARYEPFGLSVLEAALSGCALVLGDIPSLRELWGDAALFVDPDDHDTLATTITWLTEDAPMRRALSARARHVALRFTPARMATGYLEVYERAASAHALRTRSVACAS